MKVPQIYMKRCLDLARLGSSSVSPNPMVGCVLVYEDKIIGEGYHQNFGGPHAEVNAIKSVKKDNLHLIPKSTLYVNLEPCSHKGKTPPCSEFIIKHKIRNIVIGSRDPNALVKGKGIAQLEAAGCSVKTGVLGKACRELNKRFFTFHQKKRPYIILKWAESEDRFIARDLFQKMQISNEIAQRVVHKWRTEEMAIMVGTNTAQFDNPKLNSRLWMGRNPVRVLIDKNNRLSNDLNLFDQSIRTIVFTEHSVNNKKNLEYIQIHFDEQFILSILNYLHSQDINSLFIEGGTILLNTFIENGLWDEARILKGNVTLGSGIAAPFFPGKIKKVIPLADNHLIFCKPR